LVEPNREFAATVFVELEVWPRTHDERRAREEECAHWDVERAVRSVNLRLVVIRAKDCAGRSGLAPMHAVHVAAALEPDCEESVTEERSGEPHGRDGASASS
jgi:hypothetical protein